MATQYFDRNGATAGFGTLTGAWDTTTASWTTSTAGTTVPTTFTFASGDTAAFGFAGTAAVAGTATISTGITVSLTNITTANLAGLQTIAAGGTGALSLVGATPTLDIGSAGGLTISAPITGTAGFTKAGAGTLSVIVNSPGLTGTVTSDVGTLAIGSTVSSNVFPSSSGFLISSGATVAAYHANFAAYTLPSLTGAGTFSLTQSNTSTYAANGTTINDMSAFTGTVALTGNATAATSQAFAGTNSLPTSGSPKVKYEYTLTSGIASNVVRSFTLPATYSGALTSPLGFQYTSTTNGSVTTTAQNILYADQTSGPVTLTGGFDRTDSFATPVCIFSLGGTNTQDNTFSGAITQSGGRTVSLTKINAGKWILSGTNTYTGTTTINAGTLAGNSTSAFGTIAGTTSVVTQTGGTLEFGAVVNKGANAVTLVSASGATAISAPASVTAGLTCAGVTLSSTIITDIGAGSVFTLTNSAAMTGSAFGITKNGAGEFVIASTANTFNGVVTVAAGTLTFGASVLVSTNGPLGNAASAIPVTGTLKYNGTTPASVTRSITFTGATPAIDASGTGAGAVTFSAYTHGVGARTLTIKGANAGNNTFSQALTDNGADVVALTKTGAGKWILSAQPTYTGLTTVSVGELQFSGLNLSNNLTVNGTGKLSNTVINGTSKTITCDGGTPEIVATVQANTVTGSTAVTAGTLRLTTEVSSGGKPVEVTGDTNVTVSSGAAIRTSTGTLQRGQMRYGGNVTFNGGSTLYIGG